MSHLNHALDMCIARSSAPTRPHPVMDAAARLKSKVLRGAVSLFGYRPPTGEPAKESADQPSAK